MTQPRILFDRVWKKFHRGQIHDSLRDLSPAVASRLIGRSPDAKELQDGDFWAVKDLSFEVLPGQTLGIIGPNGSGKSTSLKLLTQILEPSRGYCVVDGRPGTLIEVSAGFHGDLTGRENVFLQGAIMGMRRADIERKFDEIIEFSGIGDAIDTPVKRYSSGMYVRLAFAVAAHLEPEVLIIDEVLAVGDTAFQKKCLGKIKEVGASGRTALFVSHNMSAIMSLCSRCVVLQNGGLLADLPPADAVNLYLREASASDSFTRPAQSNGNPTLVSGQVVSLQDSPVLRIALSIFAAERCAVSLDLRLADGMGVPVAFGSLGTFCGEREVALNPGANPLVIELPTDQLANGSYFISLELTEPFEQSFDWAENCLSVDLARMAPEGGARILAQSWGCGSVQIPLSLTGAGAP